MMRVNLYIILVVLATNLLSIGKCWAQAEVDKSIIMTGDLEEKRQIKNISPAEFPNDAANASSVQNNETRYNMASGSDSIYFNANPALVSYSAGLSLYFKASSNNTGAVSVNVNSLGPIQIKKGVNKDLISNDIRAGEINLIIFDGSNFQLISDHSKHCPLGFTEANSKFCIETNERAASNFFQAVGTCYDLNARLCTWGEWYYACQKSALSLSNMTNNYEWCDSATNENGYVRVNGSGSCTMIGQGLGTTSIYSFRCCFSK